MTESDDERTLGAVAGDQGVHFRVWAPAAQRVELLLEGSQERLPLEREAGGYHSIHLPGAEAGDRYRYRLDGGPELPDPASRWQPEGVHGPSEVVDPRSFRWRHEAPPGGSWRGGAGAAPRSQPAGGVPGSARAAGSGGADAGDAPTAIYELHIGTFTPQGTFAAAAERLPYLAELGVTTLELMPVADFPGRWNWGYDPGAFFAPSRAYGPPDDLRRLVDEAHGLGLEVILDVVYNHFGPDGAYLPAFGPTALTDRHTTPWGKAVDFDGPHSEAVRRFCLENALMWLLEYRFDGLRLDATFAIVDDRPRHLLAELAASAGGLPGPPRLLVAEDPRNLRNLVLPPDRGGMGLGAVWADDFHHQIRVRLTGEDRGYFRDFTGSSGDIARTLTGNWYYSGHHSRNEGRPRGTPGGDLPPERFVYCIQNHDQVGNRPQGDRLSAAVEPHEYRAASALLLFVPQLPMLFMGQEWAAGTPFQFFTDHQGELGEAVSAGRRREFSEFAFGDEVPDPQDPETFRRSVMDWSEIEREPHAGVLRLYRDLLALRRSTCGPLAVDSIRPGGLLLRRGSRVLAVAFQGNTEFELPEGVRLLLSSEDPAYAREPLPPRLSGSHLSFPRAAAVLAESPVA